MFVSFEWSVLSSGDLYQGLIPCPEESLSVIMSKVTLRLQEQTEEVRLTDMERKKAVKSLEVLINCLWQNLDIQFDPAIARRTEPVT